MERGVVITFANPITQIYHSLFIKNPAETFNWMAYIEPLHWLAWTIIVVFLLSAPPVLWIAARYLIERIKVNLHHCVPNFYGKHGSFLTPIQTLN